MKGTPQKGYAQGHLTRNHREQRTWAVRDLSWCRRPEGRQKKSRSPCIPEVPGRLQKETEKQVLSATGFPLDATFILPSWDIPRAKLPILWAS